MVSRTKGGFDGVPGQILNNVYAILDAILALRLLSELHREFGRPLNVAYIDIKAAFDSVNRNAF